MRKLAFVSCLLLSGCGKNDTCAKYESVYRTDSVHVVIRQQEISGRRVKLDGYHPVNRKPVKYRNISGIFLYVQDVLQIGDTLKKELGSLSYVIKKSDRNITLEYNCNVAVSVSIQLK